MSGVALALLLGVGLAADPVVEWTFETSDGGFVPEDPVSQWEWGAFHSTYGPGRGMEGQAGWATVIAGPHVNDADSALRLPAFDLSGLSAPMLSLQQWYSLDAGDYAWFEVRGAEGWERVELVYGYPDVGGLTGGSGGWQEVFVDLVGVADASDVRLVLSSDDQVTLAGWYIDGVAIWEGDVAPPHVRDLTALPDTEDLDGPYPVQVAVVDNAASPGVRLMVQVNDGVPQVIPMTRASGNRWTGAIPGGHAPDTTISYRVEADDGHNLAVMPVDGPNVFRVRLPAPTDLVGPEGRVVDVEATLRWTPPTSAHTLDGYRVYRDGVAVADVTAPVATVALGGDGQDVFEVAALFDVGEGDRSAPVSLDVSLPEVLSLEPDSAWQGDVVRLDLRGSYLLLAAADIDASLGEGLTLLDADVVSVDQALLTFEIADTAPAGGRDLRLVSGELTLDVPDAFRVLDGSGRPRLLRVEPDFLRQGESGRVVLTASAAFADDPSVDLGDGVIVEGIERLDDAVVAVDVVVDPNAPIGKRRILLDDGERITDDLSFEVRDGYGEVLEQPCSTTPRRSGASLALLALAVLGLRRRR